MLVGEIWKEAVVIYFMSKQSVANLRDITFTAWKMESDANTVLHTANMDLFVWKQQETSNGYVSPNVVVGKCGYREKTADNNSRLVRKYSALYATRIFITMLPPLYTILLQVNQTMPSSHPTSQARFQYCSIILCGLDG
jgi:hypothetical protein